jgi:hypothetical protein
MEDVTDRACSSLRDEVCAEFWFENLKTRDQSEDLVVDGKPIQIYLERGCEWVWTIVFWFTAWTGGRLLWKKKPESINWEESVDQLGDW